jgi:hypothetical protein
MGRFYYVERWTRTTVHRHESSKVDTDHGTPTRVFKGGHGPRCTDTSLQRWTRTTVHRHESSKVDTEHGTPTRIFKGGHGPRYTDTNLLRWTRTTVHRHESSKVDTVHRHESTKVDTDNGTPTRVFKGGHGPRYTDTSLQRWTRTTVHRQESSKVDTVHRHESSKVDTVHRHESSKPEVDTVHRHESSKVDTDHGTPTRVFKGGHGPRYTDTSLRSSYYLSTRSYCTCFINFESCLFLTINHFKYESCGIIKCVSDKKI